MTENAGAEWAAWCKWHNAATLHQRAAALLGEAMGTEGVVVIPWAQGPKAVADAWVADTLDNATPMAKPGRGVGVASTAEDVARHALEDFSSFLSIYLEEAIERAAEREAKP